MVQLVDHGHRVVPVRAPVHQALALPHQRRELQRLQHLTQLNHEFYGLEPLQHVLFLLDLLHNLVFDALGRLFAFHVAAAFVEYLRADLFVVFRDDLVYSLQRGLVDVAGHDRVLEEYEPINYVHPFLQTELRKALLLLSRGRNVLRALEFDHLLELHFISKELSVIQTTLQSALSLLV